MSMRGRSGWAAFWSVVGLAITTSVLSEAVLARSSATYSSGHTNYAEVPLSTLKGSLASGDPAQLPLIALSSAMGKPKRQPQVELDRSNPKRIIAWVTYLGLEDDSLKGIRYRVEMVPSDSLCSCQSWKVSWVGRQYRCQAGRGSQDWSAQICR